MATAALTFDANLEGARPNIRVSSLPESTTHCVVSATGGILCGLAVSNNSGTATRVQLHDAASLPANGAVPIMTFYLAAVTNLDLCLPPIPVANGLVVVASTAINSLTLDVAANINVLATFRK